MGMIYTFPCCFFFNDTATTEIYTLSLHDALPISPDTFTAEQIVQIINLACTPPADAGRPVDAWTPRELADEAVKRQIVPTISPTSVGRFLKTGRSATASQPLLAHRQDQSG